MGTGRVAEWAKNPSDLTRAQPYLFLIFIYERMIGLLVLIIPWKTLKNVRVDSNLFVTFKMLLEIPIFIFSENSVKLTLFHPSFFRVWLPFTKPAFRCNILGPLNLTYLLLPATIKVWLKCLIFLCQWTLFLLTMFFVHFLLHPLPFSPSHFFIDFSWTSWNCSCQPSSTPHSNICTKW
jgi:hypothetical protein